MTPETITGEKAAALCRLLDIDLGAAVTHRCEIKRSVTACSGGVTVTITRKQAHVTHDHVTHDRNAGDILIFTSVQGDTVKRFRAQVNEQGLPVRDPVVLRVPDEAAEAKRLAALADQVFSIVDRCKNTAPTP